MYSSSKPRPKKIVEDIPKGVSREHYLTLREKSKKKGKVSG